MNNVGTIIEPPPLLISPTKKPKLAPAENSNVILTLLDMILLFGL